MQTALEKMQRFKADLRKTYQKSTKTTMLAKRTQKNSLQVYKFENDLYHFWRQFRRIRKENIPDLKWPGYCLFWKTTMLAIRTQKKLITSIQILR